MILSIIRNSICEKQIFRKCLEVNVLKLFNCACLQTQHCNAYSQFSKLQALKQTEKLKTTIFGNEFRRRKSDDHTTVWKLERLVSFALLPVIPAAFYCPNDYLDYALIFLMMPHIHWGIEAICVEYIRTSLVGPFIPILALGTVYFISLLTLYGLWHYKRSVSLGIGETVQMFWSIKGVEPEEPPPEPEDECGNKKK